MSLARPPTRALPWLVLALLGLLVLVAREAWGQDAASVVPAGAPDWIAIADDWLVRVGLGIVVGVQAWPVIRDRLGLAPERRREPEPTKPDEQPVTRAEVRAMVTDTATRLERESEAQHGRIRGELARLEREVLALGARLTQRDHDDATRQASLSRELGAIGAGIEHLRRAAEER